VSKQEKKQQNTTRKRTTMIIENHVLDHQERNVLGLETTRTDED
jgi:hypothetical protein